MRVNKKPLEIEMTNGNSIGAAYKRIAEDMFRLVDAASERGVNHSHAATPE